MPLRCKYSTSTSSGTQSHFFGNANYREVILKEGQKKKKKKKGRGELFGYQGMNILKIFSINVIVVQLLSHVRFFVTPRTAACQASLSFTIFWSLLKLMSIELMSVKTSAIWAVTYTIHQKHSLDPIVLFFNFNFFKLGITTLQYCVDFFHIAT